MLKTIITALTFFSFNSYCQQLEDIRSKSENITSSFSQAFSVIPNPQAPSFSTENSKYNQQNIALGKIKVNELHPDMDNSAVLIPEKGDINFYISDLTKAGFIASAYQDNNGDYFIIIDLTGKNAASEAVGLAKYYYVKEVRVGKKTYKELFPDKSSYAVKMGTLKGLMNYAPANITFDKLNWLIRGDLNLGSVWLEINHENKTINGSINQIPAALKFDWSVEEITVMGSANHWPVNYTVNWKKGVLKGYSNNAPILINFDMKESQAGENNVKLAGYANNAPVELSFDKVSGDLKGYMNNAPVEVKLQNCDLYDFIQYIFVFLNEK